MGGGGIYFAINPKTKYRWINDMHSGLMSVYRALSLNPEKFIKACRDIPPSQFGEMEVSTKENGKKYNARLGEVFQRLSYDEKGDQALRYFFINRTVWAGRVNYDIPSRLYYSNPTGWNIVTTGRLEEASNHIQGTTITTGDYRTLLESPGKDVFIYCDPPYIVNTKMTKTDQQYQHNFSMDDHKRFVDEVIKCEHKICISYDNCNEVREWFSGSQFTIHSEEWKYSGSSMSTKKTGKELIITNY